METAKLPAWPLLSGPVSKFPLKTPESRLGVPPFSGAVSPSVGSTSGSLFDPHDSERLCPFFFFFLPFPKLGNLGNILEEVLEVGGGGAVVFSWLESGSSCSSVGGKVGGVGKPQDLLRRCPFLGVDEAGEGVSILSVGSCGILSSKLGIWGRHTVISHDFVNFLIT